MLKDIGPTVAELKIQYPTGNKKDWGCVRIRLGTQGVLVADNSPVWTKSVSIHRDESIKDLNDWADLLISDPASNFSRSYPWYRSTKPEKVYRLRLGGGSKSTACSVGTFNWAPTAVRHLIQQMESYTGKRK